LIHHQKKLETPLALINRYDRMLLYKENLSPTR
jgi:hypothetical protein